MGHMQPFREFTNIGPLNEQAKALARHAAGALNTNKMTERNYRPVVYDWEGMGQDQAVQAPASLKQTAYQSHTAVSWAGVVTAMWCTQLYKFNHRVDQIKRSWSNAKANVERTEKATHYPSTAPEPLGVKDLGAKTDPAAELARLKAKAVAEYNHAYETMILDQRWRFRSMLKQGPTVDNIDRARKWGVLPDPSPDPFADGMDGILTMFKPVADLGQWLFSMTFQAHSTGTGLWKSFNEWFHTPGVSADMENFTKQFGRIGSVFGLYTSFKSQWDADRGRRMGTEERVTRSVFRTAMDFGGSTAGAAVGGFAGGAAGLLGGPAAPVTVPLGAVGGGLVGGAAVGNAMHHVGDILIDPVGRGMRNLSELARRQPGLYGGPTT